MDFNKAINIVLDAGNIVREALKDNKGLSVEKKRDRDFVTAYDLKVQSFILKQLSIHYPGCAVMAEEEDYAKVRKDSMFVLDPIDGTTNFMHSYEPFCISLAYVIDNKPVFGVVYEPVYERLFRAEAGKGAFLNDEKISVSSISDLSMALTAAETCPYERDQSAMHFEKLRKLFLASVDLRICGAAAMGICYVAAGMSDVFMTRKLSPWDYAAACCILSEAGGTYTDWNLEPVSMYEKSDILATNTLLQEDVYGIIQ